MGTAKSLKPVVRYWIQAQENLANDTTLRIQLQFQPLV